MTPTRYTGSESRKREGFTLIELLVSMTILAGIMGAVASAFVIGYRSYFSHKAHYDAASKASTSIQIGLRDLADGAIVTKAESDDLQYQKPLPGNDDLYVLDDQGGIAVKMTACRLGDEMRIFKVDDLIYLDDLDDADPAKLLADGVLELKFLYDGVDPDVAAADPLIPDVAPPNVKSVTVILTAADKPFAPEGVMQITRTVRLRNHL